jgi:hypothetical protein
MEHQSNAGGTFLCPGECYSDLLIGFVADEIINLFRPLSPELLSNPT